MKKTIQALAVNPWINLVIAVVCIVSGLFDILTMARDVEQSMFSLHAGHGIAALGFWNALQALGAIFSSLDYASKASH